MLSSILNVNEEYELTEQQLQENTASETLLDNFRFLEANKVVFKIIKFCSNYQFEMELLYYKGDKVVAKQFVTEYLSFHFPPLVEVNTPEKDKGNLIGYLSNQSVFENSTVIAKNVDLVKDGEFMKGLQRCTRFSTSNQQPILMNIYSNADGKIFEEDIHLTNYVYAVQLHELLQNK